MLVLVLLVAIVAFAVLLLTFLGYRTDQKVALSSKQVGLSGPDITVDVDKEAQRIGDYQQVCAITITNVGAKELDRCLVEITKFSGVRPKGMPMPLTLRTEEQVRGGGAGRFTLSKGQRKAIPILFVRTQRANEWFFFDENKKQYFIPAHPTELRLRIYGGDEPLAGVLFIDVDAGWNAFPTLTITSNQTANIDDAKSREVSLREAAAELYGQIADTTLGKTTGDNCASEEEIWDAMGTLIIHRGGVLGRKPGSSKIEEVDKRLWYSRVVGGAKILRDNTMAKKTTFTDLRITRSNLDRVIESVKSVANQK
jgi:hypothetical protein